MGQEQDHRNRPPPTPSPTPSGSSESSSVVDAEWVEVPTKEGPARTQGRPLAVVRAVRGSGRGRGPSIHPRSPPVLARARCVVCAAPAVSTAKLFSVAHVPLCQRCGAVGAVALRLLGGA
jgi:hypothetical protein